MIFELEVKFEQNLMTLKFKMSMSPGSMNFEVYMPKNRRFGPFFWGRWKLITSDFHQILHGRTATCSLGAHQISAFQVHAFWRYYPTNFRKWWFWSIFLCLRWNMNHLETSDCRQILQEGNVTCPLVTHRNSAF